MEQMGINQTANYNAAIYCRLSKDDEQAGESVSIGTQKLMLEKYCLEQNFHICDVYADDGYSGLNFNRPEFNRLLTDIDNGKVNLVITKDLSRLGPQRIQNAVRFAGDKDLEVSRSGVIQQGHHRAADVIANGRAIDVIITVFGDSNE